MDLLLPCLHMQHVHLHEGLRHSARAGVKKAVAQAPVMLYCDSSVRRHSALHPCCGKPAQHDNLAPPALLQLPCTAQQNLVTTRCEEQDGNFINASTDMRSNEIMADLRRFEGLVLDTQQACTVPLAESNEKRW